MGIENKNIGKQKDTTAQEKASDEVQKKGMSFFDLQLAALQKIGEETAQSFKEAQKNSRARIGESPEKATLEQNMAALKDSQTQIPDINEQLKKQNEHLQKLKDIDIEKSLGEAVKENASWFANTDDIVSSSLRLMNMRNEKIKLVEDSIQATEKQMNDAMAAMYVNAYFIAQKSSKTPQEVTKKTDALALEAFDQLGDNIPETLKNPLREARERALQSEQLKAFDRLYLAGDFAGALRTLGQENESNSPIGLDTHKFSRSEIASAYLASTMANANESKNISYRIAHGSPAEQKLREGYICIAFPGDTAEHAFGFMTMAKKMPDGSLSVSFFDQQGKTPTSQDSLTYQDEYHLLPRDIADSNATEAEMEKNFDRVVGKIPSFRKMGEATKTLQQTFMPMQRLFIDAQSGNMPKDFVNTVKGMATQLQNTNILSIIRANMGDVKKDLEILKKIPVGENGKLEQRIAELEKGYTRMARLLENHTVEDFCDKILNPAFVADNFKSWAIKEGIVMTTAIGSAIVIGGVTFLTGGAGLAVSAALGAAGGVIGSEAGYVLSEQAGETEYGSEFSNKSQFGSYLSDEKVFDATTGTFRKLEGSEVALSYGKDFLMNFGTTLVTLGLGRVLNAKLIKWVEAAKGKSEVRQAVANITKRVFDLDPQEVDLLKNNAEVQKFLKRTFGELFEEGGEEAVQSGVQQMDDNLSQVVGLITAMRGNGAIQQTVGGRAIRDGGFSLEGNNLVKTISVQGNAADVSGLSQRVSEAMGAQGYSVKVNEDGTIDCTKSSADAEGGKSVILRFKEIFDEDLSVGAAGAGGGEETVSPLPETRLENESVSYPTLRESDAVNRVFEGGILGIGRNNPISLKTDPSSAYRSTGMSQIQDIVESGFVRPPIGKLKGGRRGEVHWSRGHDKLFYYDKTPVIEIDASKVEGDKKGAVKLSDLKAIWIFNETTQRYENRLDAYKAQQEQTPLADSSIANFADTQARNVFPDDVEMQQLYKKSLIGLQVLTDVEQAALDTAFASREKPSSLHQVRLYESKHFVIPADAKNPEYILTNQLDGCTAVVVIAEMPNGERHVLISHFPPFMKDRNVSELSALITPEIQGASKKTLLIVKNGKREVNTNEVRDGIQTALGENTVVKEMKYTNNGKDGDGALIVEVPATEKGVPSAHANNNGEHVVLNIQTNERAEDRARRAAKKEARMNDPEYAAQVARNGELMNGAEGKSALEKSLRDEGILKEGEVMSEDDFKCILEMHQLGGSGRENLLSKRKIAEAYSNTKTTTEEKGQWRRMYEHALEEGFAGGYAFDSRGQLVPESDILMSSPLRREDIDLLLSNPDSKPVDILNLLEAEFKDDLDADAGVSQGYSIREHTIMVLSQFEKYYGNKELPAGVSKKLLSFVLAVHDLGKPRAIAAGNKDAQHEHTVGLVEPLMQRMGYSQDEVNIALALIDGDPLGNYLRDIQSSPDTAQKIFKMAQKAGMKPEDFYQLLVVYYQCDAASYTEDAGGERSLDGLFSFDPQNRAISFAPRIQGKLDILAESVSILSFRKPVEVDLNNTDLQSKIASLRKEGFVEEANAIEDAESRFSAVDGTDISTTEARIAYADHLLALSPEARVDLIKQRDLDEKIRYMRTQGGLKDFADELSDTSYNFSSINGVNISTPEARLSHAENLLSMTPTEKMLFRDNPNVPRISQLTGGALVDAVNEFTKQFPNEFSSRRENWEWNILEANAEGQVVAIDSFGDLRVFENIGELNIVRDRQSMQPFSRTLIQDIDTLRSSMKRQGVDSMTLKLGNEEGGSFLRAPEITVNKEILSEAQDIARNGLDSLYFHGTSSAALFGIEKEGFALVSAERLLEKDGALRSGERNLGGGSGVSNDISAGRGSDGLATGLSYSYREFIFNVDNIPVEKSDEFIGRLNDMQGKAMRGELSDDECRFILSPNAYPPKWVLALGNKDLSEAVANSLQQMKERLYFRNLRERMPDVLQHFPVLFGFSGKGHQYSVEIVEGRSSTAAALAGEVRMGPEVSFGGGMLSELFVPKAHFADAEAFLMSAGLTGKVRVVSIEAVYFAMAYGIPTASKTFTLTMDTIHLRQAQRMAASFEEILNNQTP